MKKTLAIFREIGYNNIGRNPIDKNAKEVNIMSFKVTEDTIIGDIMDVDESTAEFFMDMGMHCLFCPASRGETVKQACEVHGVEPKELIDKLNAHFAD